MTTFSIRLFPVCHLRIGTRRRPIRILNGDFRKCRLRSSTKFEVRRPSRSEITPHLVCQLSIYNSFSVIRTTIAKKSSFLRTKAFIFCLPWGRPCGNHAKRCMNEKTIQCLPNPSQHVPISVFNTFSVIRTASAKNRRLVVTLYGGWATE